MVRLPAAQPSYPGGLRAACQMLTAPKSALCKGGRCLSLGKNHRKWLLPLEVERLRPDTLVVLRASAILVTHHCTSIVLQYLLMC